jgi:TRAP-type C4-dicarboxylate transport system permease small subunit
MKQVGLWLYNNLIEWLVGFILLVIVLLAVMQVFNRYVMDNPLNWTEEIARLLLVWAVSLGAAAGIKHNGHLRVDLLFNKYKGNAGRIIIVLINLVMLSVGVGMIKFGFDFYASTANDYSTSLGYARNLFYLAIPISGILTVFFLVVTTVRDWKDLGKTHPRETPPIE